MKKHQLHEGPLTVDRGKIGLTGRRAIFRSEPDKELRCSNHVRRISDISKKKQNID